ncbi:Pyruvate/Phosphoenolpyruvate kinase-like domain-containing protein [Apiosordaria backusii]|uniref:Pyruvate/Phosphoenolpyruvate kinase-like domain-containing protein n=1 Tax=Apiosordaria backusii TaxID=314023 RepID=A0AA40BNU8_9PEZI|nr:Pyruvate/Phosphoenolpyruvate kinase-like domain-containing protein [Apiosordaria backusii]
MSATSTLRRALLYVPSSSQKFLSKSLLLPHPTDNITYDLEDSVTPSLKPTARTNLLSHLSSLSKPSNIGELAVRINAISTPYALSDLTTLAPLPSSTLSAIVIPKVNSPSDLTFVIDILRQVSNQDEPPKKLIALIESARAVMDLKQICEAGKGYLDGLIFAAEDFALDLSLTRTPSLREFLYARSAIATAARAFELSSTIDLVCTSYKGEEGKARLEEECRDGKEVGFNGKQCIHPTQVEVVQRMFAPNKEEVEWAIRVVIADAKAQAAGRGAWTMDGKMIDAPVVGKAHFVVAKAEKCGLDVDGLKNKWQGQEPE